MSHKKFGPDRFSRFDVYWIQTNKQTNKQTDKPNLYIDCEGEGKFSVKVTCGQRWKKLLEINRFPDRKITLTSTLLFR